MDFETEKSNPIAQQNFSYEAGASVPNVGVMQLYPHVSQYR